MRTAPLVLALLLAAGSATAQDGSLPPGPALPPPAMDAPAANAALDTALAGDWRSAANRARDQYRHPRETLGFFGVRADQTVIEIWPGGGWYAEVLAPMLRANGHYIGVMPPSAVSAGSQRNNDKLRAMFAARADLFDKGRLIEADLTAPVLGAPGSADVVLTFRNAHNWVMTNSQAAMFKAMFTVLKPGGTLGVVDHRARADQPAAEMKSSGYLPEAYVIKLAEDAGFVLEDKSEVNANPRDTKDYAEGVWTLPPTLTLGEKDRDKYLAIGESDRMTLRFIKPAGQPSPTN
jgi:predicted methyltransferase